MVMQLKKIKIKNFRSYVTETEISFDSELTAFLGRNDAGKSSILEALEIFFNNETVAIEPSDLSVRSTDNVISITCIFDQLPHQVIVDDNYPTSLETEYLTNSEGNIEICKKFKVQATVSKPVVFIIANHPANEGINNLHSLKLNELKALGKTYGVESAVADQRVASLWRRAIWSACNDLTLKEQEISVGDLGTDSKAIYSKIETLLPTFALFKADRASNDVDPEAKNPMQAAVKQAQKELHTEIEALQKKIEDSVIEVANRTLDKIREMDPNLANELKPKFKEKPKWTFNFSLDGDEGIPINKRGSGVRRLILLNFFRAEAEKRQIEQHAPRVIYAIEEPETSQHPNYQIMLIEALMRLASRPDCQIILTTHVPALAGLLPIDAIRFVSKTEYSAPQVLSGTAEVLNKAANSLGVFPEPGIAGAKAVLLVEGHSDVTFINHAATELKNGGFLPATLVDRKIAAIPIGGCGNLKYWVTKQLVEQLGLDWAVLMDSDIGDPVQHQRNVEKMQDIMGLGKIALLTKKREPENYIDPSVIKTRYNVDVTYTEVCDAKKIIASSTKTRPEDVLERLWPLMDFAKMVKQSTYIDGTEERIELVDILSKVLTLADNN
jgi:energy-coupling factor transporter ATP-binding protein EcfA2